MRYLVLIIAAWITILRPEPMLFAEERPISQSDADARASMALAKAKAQRPSIVAQTRPIPYADAVKVARKENKPLLIAVNLACRDLCDAVRPDVITCHEREFERSSESRAIICVPAPGDKWYRFEWKRCPTLAEVRGKVADLKPHAMAEVEADYEAAVMAMIVAMTGLEGDTPAPVEWKQVCENGVCRMVPVGYQAMPATVSGASAASPPAVSETASSGRFFKARFPRVAAFRQRVRGVLRLQPPQIRGQFFDAVEQDLAEQTTSMPATRSSPLPATSLGREHRLLKAFLRNHGVSQDDIAAIEAKAGDGSIWATLVKLLIEQGLPMLIEFLQSFLNK